VRVSSVQCDLFVSSQIMDIQSIYAAAWSKYVLKYALECEPTVHLANSEEMKRPIGEKTGKSYERVVFNQLHACNDQGCKRKMIGKCCKYGFPGPPKLLGYDDELKHWMLLASAVLSQQPLRPSDAALACLDIAIISNGNCAMSRDCAMSWF
jgi:hypothetical protein